MIELPTKPKWHAEAACEGTKDPVFFPPDSPSSEMIAAKEAAKKFCDYCHVYRECLESALRNGDVGVWAGTSTSQRDQLRRKRHRRKCPVCVNRMLIKPDEYWFCLGCGASWKGELMGKQTKINKKDNPKPKTPEEIDRRTPSGKKELPY